MNTTSSGTQKIIDKIAGQPGSNIQAEHNPQAAPAGNGYHILFHGSPEAAKAFATHLGAEMNKEVHTIASSRLTSQYIGETEKNLEKFFPGPGQKAGILFFDEADSLFGKRSDVKDAHDRYATQDSTSLLQRIGNYPGPVILATNKKADTDPHIDPHFPSLFNTILRPVNPGV